MVDPAKLNQLLASLSGYVSVLKSLAAVPPQEFLQNPDKIGNAKYHLVIAIECCVDVANHVIASEKMRIPLDNGDSFAVLKENGLVTDDLLPSLKAMARFRNRLVHLYWKIDDAKVYEYLQSSLEDISRFSQDISKAFSKS